MKISFLLNGLDVGQPVREYITKKCESVQKKYSTIEEADIDISRNKHRVFRIEIMMRSAYNMYRAEESAVTIELATDNVINELKEQIRNDREKRSTLKRRGARSVKKKAVIDVTARF